MSCADAEYVIDCEPTQCEHALTVYEIQVVTTVYASPLNSHCASMIILLFNASLNLFLGCQRLKCEYGILKFSCSPARPAECIVRSLRSQWALLRMGIKRRDPQPRTAPDAAFALR